jgi:UPF0755 protein
MTSPRIKKRSFILFPAAAVVVCCALVGWALFGGNVWKGRLDKTFLVSRGESFSHIVDSLEAQGIIRNRPSFILTARLLGGAGHLQVGKYLFASGVSNVELYLALRSGKGNLLIAVTIPEGYRVRAQARIFAQSMGIDSARYAQLAFDSSFTRSLGVEASTLEGYLFPDTYEFSWGQDEKDIIRHQVGNLMLFFNDSLRSRAREKGWTMHQTLTFASIVEGEARLEEERPVIAGVYRNRLRKGMKLEADPTIQYMFPDGPRRVRYADLQVDNPYNSYRYAGLPPGPVNNPGRASILASLYPAEHGFLFFVANGRGGHWFTKTYRDHLRYVRAYRRRQARPSAHG